MKLFVMSDIHSYHFSMMQALYKNGFDHDDPNHHLVICGDLFDRGPDAVKTFEFVKEMAEAGRLTYIRGNHEDLLFDCVEEIAKGAVSQHHISNGTFDTVLQFTGGNYYDLRYGFADRGWYDNIRPLLDFIAENAFDHAIAGDYVFVHGWVPCTSGGLDENWNSPDANWDGSRWINGMEAWAKGYRPEGKTVVCGHWHCSWGWSHLRLERKEFPKKHQEDWRESFEPFIDDGIIALDACTAYTGFCNCVVLEVNEVER